MIIRSLRHGNRYLENIFITIIKNITKQQQNFFYDIYERIIVNREVDGGAALTQRGTGCTEQLSARRQVQVIPKSDAKQTLYCIELILSIFKLVL